MIERWRCADHQGRIIILTEDRWSGHALINHPELACHDSAIMAAIIKPDRVTQDGRHANGENYHALGVLPPPLDRVYLKVCVRFTAAGPSAHPLGGIITAYPTSAIKRTEVQLWP